MCINHLVGQHECLSGKDRGLSGGGPQAVSARGAEPECSLCEDSIFVTRSEPKRRRRRRKELTQLVMRASL